jgi:hypothetical protein
MRTTLLHLQNTEYRAASKSLQFQILRQDARLVELRAALPQSGTANSPLRLVETVIRIGASRSHVCEGDDFDRSGAALTVHSHGVGRYRNFKIGVVRHF